MSKYKSHFGFWKTTMIGGLIFLLPLIVLGIAIGQIVPILLTIAEVLYEYLPFKTPQGIAFLLALSVLILLLICFVAGLLARRSFAKRISGFFEKNISMMFPRYTIIKEQMKGSLGGNDLKPGMQPVLARFDDHIRLGFEMERPASDLVAVYLPGAPDAWSGFVVYVAADRVVPVNAPFGDVVAVSEQLGRGSTPILISGLATRPSPPPASVEPVSESGPAATDRASPPEA